MLNLRHHNILRISVADAQRAHRSVCMWPCAMGFLAQPAKAPTSPAVCPSQNQAAVQRPILRNLFPTDPARLGRSYRFRGYPPHWCRLQQQPRRRQRAGPLQTMAPEGMAASRGLRACNSLGRLLAATLGELLRYRNSESFCGLSLSLPDPLHIHV